MMRKTNQEKLAGEYGIIPFEVCVLEPIRTICEKIMSLVRFSYGENPMDDLRKKIRHTYDLHQLLQQKEYSIFFDSTAFDKMLLKVANDDVSSFKNNNKWLIHHPKEALIYNKLCFMLKKRHRHHTFQHIWFSPTHISTLRKPKELKFSLRT